jgi:hypothetical protein
VGVLLGLGDADMQDCLVGESLIIFDFGGELLWVN